MSKLAIKVLICDNKKCKNFNDQYKCDHGVIPPENPFCKRECVLNPKSKCIEAPMEE